MKKLRYAALGLLALLVFIDARLSASIECDEGFTYCIWGGLQAGYNTNQYSSLTEAFNDGPGESMASRPSTVRLSTAATLWMAMRAAARTVAL